MSTPFLSQYGTPPSSKTDAISRRAENYPMFARELEMALGVNLKRAGYYPNHILGLDVVKLNNIVKPGPSESLREAIVRVYGERIANIVDLLL